MSGLMKIGSARQEPATTTVLSRLLECHERIRRFLTIAERLAIEDAPPAERQLAARSLVRYFSHALPLHVADEDVSLTPRLVGLGAEAQAALATMTKEHHRMESVIAALLTDWQSIAEQPEDAARRTATLASVHALRDVMMPHLAGEERDVFPLLAALSAAEQAAIVAEMEARRQGA